MKKWLLYLFLFAMGACSVNTQLPWQDFRSDQNMIIYKTRADYFDKVPILLADDGRTILGYPHPLDLKTNGVLALPTRLKNGYLLDNRGIGPNVAFTRFTYAEYASLSKAPALDVLLQSVIDKAPLIEMYAAGSRSDYKNLKEINRLVTRDLDTLKKIK